MATRRLTREERQQQTRETLLRSAETLFALRGVEGTSLEEIARHAGLTQGAIYSNFKNKADLWWAIADRRSHKLDVESFFKGDRPFKDELRDFGTAGVRMMRKVSRTDLLLDKEFALFAQRNPSVRRRVVREIGEGLEVFGALLEEHAAARGEQLPLPGRELAAVIYALARGIAYETMLVPEIATERSFGEAFALLAGCNGEN